MPESTLTIARWRAEYHVPVDHPAPDALRGRLDEAAEALARDGLAAALLPLVDDADPSVWLIRRLELDLTINAAWERETAARAWAGRVAWELARTFQGGADGENVLVFPDWAAYLAHFLGDLVEGLAWGRWYYRAFEGLRMLPVSAALRTAVLDNPSAGQAALLQLSAPMLRRLIAALSVQDARRVLDGFTAAQPDAVEFPRLLAACQQARRSAFGEDHFALWITLELLRAPGASGGQALAAAARAAARLRQHLGEGARPDAALQIAARGDISILYVQVGPDDAERLLPLAGCPVELLPDLIAALSNGQPAAPAPNAPPPRRYTPFGGLFLLLPELERLPLGEMLADFPALPGEDARAALRLLLLARPGGPERAAVLFADPILRDAAGIGPRFSIQAASDWLRLVPARAWRSFGRALTIAAGASHPLGMTRVRLAGGSLLALVDLADGGWLALTGWSRRSLRCWQPVRQLLEASDPALWRGDAHLLADAAQFLNISPPDLPESRPAGHPAAGVPLNRLGAELAYLRAPDGWGIPRSADLALALAAQRMLRRFSRDLIGFQNSGMAYLFDQFLGFSAGVEADPSRWAVFLTSPPLGLILQRAGKLRLSYRVSWMDGRRIELFPEV